MGDEQRASGNPLAMAPKLPVKVQPKAPTSNPFATAFGHFARAAAPEQTAMIDERRKAEAADKAKRALIWMQQTAAQPADRRAAFTLQSAQDIARDTGQPYEAIVASANDPNAFSDEAMSGAIAKFSAMAGIAPATPDPMSEYEAAQIRLKEQEAAQPQKPITVNNRLVDPSTYEVLGDYSDPEKPVAKKYDTVQIGNDVYRVSQDDPTDKIRLGPAPPKAGAGGVGKNPNGLTPYQEIQFQYKLDDLDRELAAADKKRNSDLNTVSSSIALLDQFTGDTGTFNEVYGNWINPTGEGNDLFNPRVQPGSPRANGMAILEQLGGRAFLESIGAMRGTGPLSDREGARVMAAATRLTNVTQSDEAAAKAAQEFRQALMSYQSALQQDIANSRRDEVARRRQMEMMLGRQPSAAPQSAAPQAQTGQQSGGSVVNPLQATGDAMQQAFQKSIFDAVNSQDDGMDSYIDGLFPAEDGGAPEPDVGQVEDGYRFLGGDPSDPSNWEAVQ